MINILQKLLPRIRCFMVLILVFLSVSCAYQPVTQWEYELVTTETGNLGGGDKEAIAREKEFLNSFGADGWELIMVIPAGYHEILDKEGAVITHSFYIFKRPKHQPPKQK